MPALTHKTALCRQGLPEKLQGAFAKQCRRFARRRAAAAGRAQVQSFQRL